jgi:hypothetical protein
VPMQHDRMYADRRMAHETVTPTKRFFKKRADDSVSVVKAPRSRAYRVFTFLSTAGTSLLEKPRR